VTNQPFLRGNNNNNTTPCQHIGILYKLMILIRVGEYTLKSEKAPTHQRTMPLYLNTAPILWNLFLNRVKVVLLTAQHNWTWMRMGFVSAYVNHQFCTHLLSDFTAMKEINQINSSHLEEEKFPTSFIGGRSFNVADLIETKTGRRLVSRMKRRMYFIPFARPWDWWYRMNSENGQSNEKIHRLE
jgi:hypothetical protein